jgi:hypothetical protein
MAEMKIKSRNRLIRYFVIIVVSFVLAEYNAGMKLMALLIGLLIAFALAVFEKITEEE